MIAGAGCPAVVTVKVPALPTANVVVAALVKRRPIGSPVEPTETPLAKPGRREEAGQLAQVHAAENPDVRIAGRRE